MPQKKKSGFTIIEVVLVLAVAGLIFVMVFVALPSMQRSQRDEVRRNMLSRVVPAMIEYQAHNGNKLAMRRASGEEGAPYYDTKFVPRYMDAKCVYTAPEVALLDGEMTTYVYNNCSDAFRDPDGTSYSVALLDPVNDATTELSEVMVPHVLYLSPESRCVNTNGDFELKKQGTPQDFSAYIELERGIPICIDSKTLQK